MSLLLLSLLTRLWTWLRNHWRIALVIVLLVFTFALGRLSSKSTNNAINESVESKTLSRSESKAVVTQAKQETAKVQVVYRDRTVIKYRDGTEVHRDVETTSQSQAVAVSNSRVEFESHSTAERKFTEKVTVAEKKDAPRWSVSATAGLDFKTFKPVYGGQASYRVLGPLTVGAFGQSNLVFGVSAGLSF